MSGGGQAPRPIPASNGGDVLLSLLQKSQSQQNYNQNQDHHYLQSQSPVVDPAVAALGPTLPYPWAPPPPQQPSDGQDLLRSLLWPAATPNGGFLGFPHSYFHNNKLPGNHQPGFSNPNSIDSNPSIHGIAQQTHLFEHKLKFVSLLSEITVVSEGFPMRIESPLDRNWKLASNSSAPPPRFPGRPYQWKLGPEVGHLGVKQCKIVEDLDPVDTARVNLVLDRFEEARVSGEPIGALLVPIGDFGTKAEGRVWVGRRRRPSKMWSGGVESESPASNGAGVILETTSSLAVVDGGWVLCRVGVRE